MHDDQYASGTFTRCSQSQTNTCAKQQVSSQTVGESKLLLESFVEEHAKGVWVRNWMGLEVHATLFHTYPPILIAKILKALREEVKENNQLTTVQEI